MTESDTREISLPIEIHDLILDTLPRLYKQSMNPLSTVCQHWRLRLYRNTLADIHLHQVSALSFSSLLDSSFSSLAILPSIRNLHMRTMGTSPWTDAGLVAINHVLVKVALHTRLTSLTLSSDSAGDHQLDVASLSLQLSHFVDTVKLRRIIFRKSSDFIRFFGLFPGLKHVEFDDVLCTWSSNLQPRLPPGEFTLALIVRNELIHRINIKWTLTESVSSIELDDLHSLAQLAKANIPTLLRQFGPALRELDIDLQLNQFHDFSVESIVNALDLSSTPHLRGIRIGSSTRVLSCMQWVPKVLYGLASTNHPSLKVLGIQFASSRQFHLDRPFLRCLRQGLCKRQYSAIRELHFIAYHDSPIDEGVERAITQSIQAVLLHYHQQGLVWVTFRAREVGPQ